LTAPALRLYTIPPHRGFVDALVRTLLDECRDDPLALSTYQVLLPTRRGCRALQEAFLRASGGRALVLPRLAPLGDLDAEAVMDWGADEVSDGAEALELPMPQSPVARQLALARLVMAAPALRGGTRPSADQAARLAAELARLMDQLETERLDFSRFAALVPEAFARHWQITLDFLEIVSRTWPAVEAERGTVGPARHRNLLLERQAAAWRANPPQHPVIVAGSTGSIPATADLIAVAAGLPRGRVVLPGLDRDAEAETWQAIRTDPAHPQHGHVRLLDRLGVAPGDVDLWPDGPWPDDGAAPSDLALRTRFVSVALQPAAATERWREAAATLAEEPLDAALGPVSRIDCADPAEEAVVVALIMRHALEAPGHTVALVTPDRRLARRVAAELARWDVAVDDSAGTPLAETAPGTYARLWAEAMAESLAPVPLLAALKHPLSAGGEAPAAFRRAARALELAVLRGPRPAPGFAGLRAALDGAADGDGPARTLAELERRCGPFAAAMAAGAVPLAELLEAHLGCCEAMSESDSEPGAARLWAGDTGEALAAFAAEVAGGAADLGAVPGAAYPALLDSLMAGRVVRPRYGRHPRARILGALEARLQHADLVVLGGLNEGTWPADPPTDPWLSRPMREAVGLPSPERRVGLAAHDFAQALGAPRVVLTRAVRVDGTPTAPSRWLARIEALLRACGRAHALDRDAAHWLGMARALDRPADVRPVPPPAPRPPLAARPRRLSVTAVETWMRDPYAIFAARILGLQPLDPLDADPGAADRGRLIHRALERYVRAVAEGPDADPEGRLLEIGRAVLAPEASRPGIWAFWWPRFRRLARWFAAAHEAARPRIAHSLTEVAGRLVIEAPAGPFELTATADRIDLHPDGGFTVIDYKTGGLPSGKAVEAGLAPQLSLEAAIALAGGFPDLPAGRPLAGLEFWRVTGGEPPGEAKPLKADPEALATGARAGLERLVAAFDDPETPYLSVPRGLESPYVDPYEHLARIREWSAGGEGEP
jgi:ATP-dependent helicase/nuclease subunit B